MEEFKFGDSVQGRSNEIMGVKGIIYEVISNGSREKYNVRFDNGMDIKGLVAKNLYRIPNPSVFDESDESSESSRDSEDSTSQNDDGMSINEQSINDDDASSHDIENEIPEIPRNGPEEQNYNIYPENAPNNEANIQGNTGRGRGGRGGRGGGRGRGGRGGRGRGEGAGGENPVETQPHPPDPLCPHGQKWAPCDKNGINIDQAAAGNKFHAILKWNSLIDNTLYDNKIKPPILYFRLCFPFSATNSIIKNTEASMKAARDQELNEATESHKKRIRYIAPFTKGKYIY